MKAYGVAVAMLQGRSWAPNPSNGSRVNVGTILAVPFPASSLLVGGKARRRLMPPGWDGGPVVPVAQRFLQPLPPSGPGFRWLWPRRSHRRSGSHLRRRARPVRPQGRQLLSSRCVDWFGRCAWRLEWKAPGRARTPRRSAPRTVPPSPPHLHRPRSMTRSSSRVGISRSVSPWRRSRGPARTRGQALGRGLPRAPRPDRDLWRGPGSKRGWRRTRSGGPARSGAVA